MSSIVIGELARSTQMDRKALTAVRGGFPSLSSLGSLANVNVGISQNIFQLQNVQVNALNNVGVIGAGFGPLALNVNPSQFANLGVVI
jgi:hypothetical protein